MVKPKHYNPRKYPFAYVGSLKTVRYDQARPEFGPFFEDAALTQRLVLRRHPRTQYFARPPRSVSQPQEDATAPHRSPSSPSPHAECIRRVESIVLRGDVIRARPFDGLKTQPVVKLLPQTAANLRSCIRERSLPEDRSIRPDLQVRDARTGQLLMIVEVCCSHPVGPRKSAIFERLGAWCVEILAIHGIDEDGTLNAINLWGLHAPRMVRQAAIEDAIKPGPPLAPIGVLGGQCKGLPETWRRVRGPRIVRQSGSNQRSLPVHPVIAGYVQQLSRAHLIQTASLRVR